MTQQEASEHSIILLAKRPGETSFSSLYQVKRALHTRKVGHTGTLDSFATGLLVVCAGRYTRLVPYITQSDKTYEAIIEFGRETDTLEWTGRTIREAALPTLDAVESAIKKYTGVIMLLPPQFSAIHIDGKRASDIARSGGTVNIPQRPVTVYSAVLLDVMFASGGGEHSFKAVPQLSFPKAPSSSNRMLPVAAAKVLFTVSKGTYIRSLARDIGAACGSAASLAALRRTAVGPFHLSDAALCNSLMPFTIESAFAKNSAGHRVGEGAAKVSEEDGAQEILSKAMLLSPMIIKECNIPSAITRKFIDG